MRNYIYIFLAAVAFTACKPSAEEPSITIGLKFGEGFIAGDTTLNTAGVYTITSIPTASPGYVHASTISCTELGISSTGFSGVSASFELPTPGTYSFIITARASNSDTKNGKVDIKTSNSSRTITVTVGAPCPAITPGATLAGTSITMSPTGGAAPYTYQYVDGTSSTGFISSNTYNATTTSVTATVRDANGCTADTNIAVDVCQGVTITGTAPYSNGVVTVTPSGGTGPYTYLYEMTGDTEGYTSNNTYIPLTDGALTITIRDANGCEGVVNTTITGTNNLFTNFTGGTVGANTTGIQMYDIHSNLNYDITTYSTNKVYAELVCFFDPTNGLSLTSVGATIIFPTYGHDPAGSEILQFARPSKPQIFDKVTIHEALVAHFAQGTPDMVMPTGDAGISNLQVGDEFIGVFLNSFHFIVRIDSITGTGENAIVTLSLKGYFPQ